MSVSQQFHHNAFESSLNIFECVKGHSVTSSLDETNLKPTRIFVDIATLFSYNVSGKGPSVDYLDKEQNGSVHLGNISTVIFLK